MRVPNWLAAAAMALAACDTMDPGEPGNLVPKTVAEDASLPSIQLNGARFHAETFGNPANPVILFLHGGPGGDYRGLLRLSGLANEYYLVFWDQRGSGLSERRDKSELTIAQYMDDLDAVVQRYAGNRKVLLIGESWGGMYATNYINQHPGRVAGAVLIEPGPLDGPTMERLENDMFDLDIMAEWLNDYTWSHSFFTPDDHARWDHQFMIGSSDAQPRFHQSKTDPAPSWRMGAAANRYLPEDGEDARGVANYDFTNNLGAFNTPVLFITGGLSEVLGASLQTEQVKQFNNAKLEVVNGAGHDVAWVKSADVLALIRPYLAARKGGAQ